MTGVPSSQLPFSVSEGNCPYIPDKCPFITASFPSGRRPLYQRETAPTFMTGVPSSQLPFQAGRRPLYQRETAPTFMTGVPSSQLPFQAGAVVQR